MRYQKGIYAEWAVMGVFLLTAAISAALGCGLRTIKPRSKVFYTQHYESPLGGILLAADDTGLTGLWFEGQKYFARTLDAVSYTHLDVYKRQGHAGCPAPAGGTVRAERAAGAFPGWPVIQ